MDRENYKIFLVDDEPGVSQAIAVTLQREKYQVHCFNAAEECLNVLASEECDLLITDINMPGINGIELLNRAQNICPFLPLLAITGYGNVQIAVGAIKAGAVDFIEKPLEREAFLTKVKAAVEQSVRNKLKQNNGLTATESRILELIVTGKCNKEIARMLHRSIRTVEDHRHNIMRKIGAVNIVELVQKVSTQTMLSSEYK